MHSQTLFLDIIRSRRYWKICRYHQKFPKQNPIFPFFSITQNLLTKFHQRKIIPFHFFNFMIRYVGKSSIEDIPWSIKFGEWCHQLGHVAFFKNAFQSATWVKSGIASCFPLTNAILVQVLFTYHGTCNCTRWDVCPSHYELLILTEL